MGERDAASLGRSSAGGSNWCSSRRRCIILFIGLYPVLHSLVVSFQDVSVLMKNYDFVGFMNYSRLFEDGRLWYSMLHTGFIITVIGLAARTRARAARELAQLFLEKMHRAGPPSDGGSGGIIQASVLSPVVVGATSAVDVRQTGSARSNARYPLAAVRAEQLEVLRRALLAAVA